jgi:hypothetical protein
MGILDGLRFCFVEFSVLIRLSHHSLMTCLAVHDGIHDIISTEETIGLFYCGVLVFKVVKRRCWDIIIENLLSTKLEDVLSSEQDRFGEIIDPE